LNNVKPHFLRFNSTFFINGITQSLTSYQWYKFSFYFYFLCAIHLTILLNILYYFFRFLLGLFMNFFLEFLDFPFLFFFLLLFLKKLNCLLLIFLFIFNFLNCKLKYSTLFYLKHLSFVFLLNVVLLMGLCQLSI